MPCFTYRKIILCCFLALVCVFGLSAQTEYSAFLPARPGTSPFPSRLDKGSFMLESGLYAGNESIKSDVNKNTTFGLDLRYGLLENMEVNLSFNSRSYKVNERPIDTLFRGLDATVVGARFRISEERGIYPRIEFSGNLRLPYFGEEAFIPGDVEPSFNISFFHNANEKLNLTYGFGMFWRGPDENGFIGAKTTRFLKQKHAVFLELYSYLRGNEKNEAHIGLGYILLAKSNIQLDIGIDMGSTKSEVFFGGNLGLAILLKD